MTKKRRSEIQAELKALLQQLPANSAREWLEHELTQANADPNRDIETLEMLCASLEEEVGRKPKRRAQQKTATR